MNTFVPNTTILSAAVNANFSDIATGLSNCLTRDGQAGMTAAFKAISGSANAPSITFTADPTSGLYLAGVGILGLTQMAAFNESAYGKNFMVIDTADASTSSNINTLATAGTGAIQIGTSTTWATNGYLLCNAELMAYTVASANGLTINTRGDMGTTAISHATGSTITSLFSAVSKSNWLLPARATASRSTAAAPGNFAFNTGSVQPEYYNGTSWVGVAPNQLVPQGYLSTIAGQPITTADSTSQTSIFYNPYQGNLLPVPVNGIFTVQTFTTATIALSASQTTANIYDIYGFISSTNTTLTFGISPSWAAGTSGSVSAGSCARGTGAGGTALTRVNGVFTNTVTTTLLNGASSYSIATASGIYLGSIFIGATAGTVNLHRSYGQNRQWGVWNAFNRVPIYLKAGDNTSVWNRSTSGYLPSNNSTANSLVAFQGLAEESYYFNFTQRVNTVSTGQGYVAIGYNSTSASSGKEGWAGITGAVSLTTYSDAAATFFTVPALGINVITSLDQSVGNNPSSFNGTEAAMLLRAEWRG